MKRIRLGLAGAQLSCHTLKILRKFRIGHQPAYTNGDRHSLQRGPAKHRLAAPDGLSDRDNPQISGFIDIHTHLLPGIDDGPKDLEESISMARAAVDAGISIIVATPHLRADFPAVEVEEIAVRCDTLRKEIESRGIHLNIVSGAEVSVGWAADASDEQLVLASYGQRGRDLLVESPLAPMAGLERFLFLLRSKGYRVTLAHPERCPQFQRDDRALRELVDRGLLIQLNADSLLEPASGPVKKLARRLLTEGLGQAIASDGHRGSSWRPVTRLPAAVDAAGRLVGPERAHWMTTAAPAAIVAGEVLPEPPPLMKSRRRQRLFGPR